MKMSTGTEIRAAITTLGRHEDAPHELPPIVRIVLTQAERLRRLGAITEAKFEAQVRRLEREELNPRGLVLQVRHLSSGGARFLLRATDTGTVRHMIEYAAE